MHGDGLATSWLRNPGGSGYSTGPTTLRPLRPYERSILSVRPQNSAQPTPLLRSLPAGWYVQIGCNALFKDRMVICFTSALRRQGWPRLSTLGDAHCVVRLKLRGTGGGSRAAVTPRVSGAPVVAGVQPSTEAVFARRVDVLMWYAKVRGEEPAEASRQPGTLGRNHLHAGRTSGCS